MEDNLIFNGITELRLEETLLSWNEVRLQIEHGLAVTNIGIDCCNRVTVP